MGLFENVWFCPDCNYQNIGSGNKCENCGASFEEDAWVEWGEVVSENYEDD